MAARGGYHRLARSAQPIVYGHEFCGEVAEYGPKTRGALPPGTPVVALPFLRSDGAVDLTGLSVHAPISQLWECRMCLTRTGGAS
jgi:threonine dehydrogenase-like Zn-dependent dehydrogenase